MPSEKLILQEAGISKLNVLSCPFRRLSMATTVAGVAATVNSGRQSGAPLNRSQFLYRQPTDQATQDESRASANYFDPFLTCTAPDKLGKANLSGDMEVVGQALKWEAATARLWNTGGQSDASKL